MLPTEDLFVYVYVLIDDLVTDRIIAIPPRPGPAPACSDAELLAIAQVRHLLGRRSEAAFLAEVARDWAHLFPACRTKARLTAASAGSGAHSSSCAATWPCSCQQMTASRSTPVRCRSSTHHESAARLVDRPGRTACPVRPRRRARRMVLQLPPCVRTDLGSRVVRAWAIVPAAVNERDVGSDLLADGPPPRDLLVDKGFNGKAFAAGQASRGTAVLLPPAKGQRHRMAPILRKIIAERRNRIETTFQEITDQMELARHGAHTFWGLLTRTAAIIAAHTLMHASVPGLSLDQPTQGA